MIYSFNAGSRSQALGVNIVKVFYFIKNNSINWNVRIIPIDTKNNKKYR